MGSSPTPGAILALEHTIFVIVLSHSTSLEKHLSTRLKSSEIKTNVISSQVVKIINSLTHDQPNYIIRLYKEMAKSNPDNAAVIYDYITAEQTEINIKESTKGDKIKKLSWLSKHLNHKSFRVMTKQDILDYLNRLKKPVSAMIPSTKASEHIMADKWYF